MFVFSFKTSKKQLLSLLLCVVLLVAIFVAVVAWPSGKSDAAQTSASLSGADDAQRIAYLQSLGYQTDAKYDEVKEVLIPDTFDDVMTQYNSLQKESGMDLQPYHGKRVKVWTYQILNYPADGTVLANLYVYNDKIIGGDISSTAVDGFMTGLEKVSDLGS